MGIAVIFALLLLSACQVAPVTVEPTSAVTVVPIDSSTSGLSGKRQKLEGYFSFISPTDYGAELEEDSAFISDSAQEIFMSLAIIGAGEDERSVEELLENIFGNFEGVELKIPVNTIVDGMAGQKTEFSGVIQGGVVSGYYVTIDLGNDISFLAFGMGKVTQDTDSWQQFGQMDFTQLLDTVEILLASSF